MLQNIYKSPDISLYKIEDGKEIPYLTRFVVSSLATREICNDPQICGMEYTRNLQKTCTKLLEVMPQYSNVVLWQTQAMVLNILRGGLNFGLREALADAYGWNIHSTSFISAQRARDEKNSEHWNIIESEYRKLYLPANAQIVLGDVVATGTSLQHALRLLVQEAVDRDVTIQNILFFTFGGIRAEEILTEVALLCAREFPGFTGIDLIYLEGRFSVPDQHTPLSIKETGTDLVKLGALLTPEFIHSQYELPFYPLERCTIYDAGSRAFQIDKYVEDVIQYWEKTKKLAMNGVTFDDLMQERFPQIDATKFGKQNLISLCDQQINKLKKIITPIPKEDA